MPRREPQRSRFIPAGWRWFIAAAVLLPLAVGLMKLFIFGDTIKEFVSPDGKHVIRYDRVLSLRQLLPAFPGQGSDNAAGYIRLYGRNKLRPLYQGYQGSLFGRSMDPLWTDEGVWVQYGNEDVFWSR